eukprot:2297832-Amphidinium_carterae.2
MTVGLAAFYCVVISSADPDHDNNSCFQISEPSFFETSKFWGGEFTCKGKVIIAELQAGTGLIKLALKKRSCNMFPHEVTITVISDF